MAAITTHRRLCSATLVLAAAASCCLLSTFACEQKRPAPTAVGQDLGGGGADGKDDAAARAAFLAAYPVLMHPRCVNCHPKGDAPLQGDDSHVHTQGVTRGPDGNGKYALKCFSCHQSKNLPGENMPPGNPRWALPSQEAPLVFEGKSAGELCRQLKDPKQNGGRTIQAVIHHITDDALVLWGWDPGDGRTKPPLSHEEFARKMREWADNGAACPE